MIENISDLSDFLHRWYDEAPGNLADKNWKCSEVVRPPLAETWTRFGRLCLGADDWLRHGESSPLACQDGLVSPENMKLIDKIAVVASENQGNWVAGYNEGDANLDPAIWSSWINVSETTDANFANIGATLSEFIITISLSETTHFSWQSQHANTEISETCNIVLWEGYYYNAQGLAEKFRRPKRKIRTNEAQTRLCLDINDEFSGFAGSRAKGRERWEGLKETYGVKY